MLHSNWSVQQIECIRLVKIQPGLKNAVLTVCEWGIKKDVMTIYTQSDSNYMSRYICKNAKY